MFAQVQCLLVAAIAAVAISVPAPVTQEEYARYIAQQQTQRLEEKQPERQQANRRPVQLVQVIPASGAGAYQQPSAPRPLVYQQPSAPRSAYQQPAYQPAQAVAQPSAYQPESVYRPEPYQPAQAYAAQPSYQQPEEYSEQQYQLPAKAQPPRPKAAPKPKGQNRPERPEDEENDNNPNAQYQFSFDISDDESTNYHNRKEQRDGEKISGSYSVVDSDGFIRTVTYTADPEEGFKAEVSREPTNIQVKIPTPAPQPASPAPQYRLPKPQPQYIAASEQESEAQPADPVSGYYRPVPQQVKGLAPAAHRFAGPRPQQAGKASALGYATAPTNSPIIYQAYQQ